MSDQETKTCIHDLANNFSIMESHIGRALKLLRAGHSELTDEIARLEKADEYMKKSIQTLRDFRARVQAGS